MKLKLYKMKQFYLYPNLLFNKMKQKLRKTRQSKMRRFLRKLMKKKIWSLFLSLQKYCLKRGKILQPKNLLIRFWTSQKLWKSLKVSLHQSQRLLLAEWQEMGELKWNLVNPWLYQILIKREDFYKKGLNFLKLM